MDVKIFDVTGAERDWAWLIENYGAVEIQQPDADSYYKIVKLEERHADAAFIAKVLNADGSPRMGKTVIFYWDTADAAPGSGWLEQGVGGQTNASGDVGFGMGQGAYYFAPYQGPHKAWLFGDDVSEMLEGIGMLGGTDHWHFNATWQYVENGNGGNGSNGEDPDLEAVVAQLKRIADAAEYMKEHWPFA